MLFPDKKYQTGQKKFREEIAKYKKYLTGLRVWVYKKTKE
jgi:hypothetical protein